MCNESEQKQPASRGVVKQVVLFGMGLFSFFLLTGFFFGDGGLEKVLTLKTASGYETEGWLYKAEGEEKAVGIIFLHGKRGNPSIDHNSRLIQKLSRTGYKVLAPLMPWSERRGYEGTRSQGLEVVDAAAQSIGKERVVIIGHSMGGTGVIQYGARGPTSEVIGIIPIAIGHDPNIGMKLYGETRADASHACELMQSGKGHEKGNYPERNNTKQYQINATAEYYCTYYSVRKYPDTSDIVSTITLPVLWISGADDRLTRTYEARILFDGLPSKDKSQYHELPGTHLNVLYKHVEIITNWIDSL